VFILVTAVRRRHSLRTALLPGAIVSAVGYTRWFLSQIDPEAERVVHDAQTGIAVITILTSGVWFAFWLAAVIVCLQGRRPTPQSLATPR